MIVKEYNKLKGLNENKIKYWKKHILK